MKLPDSMTFTGVDEWTDLFHLSELANRFTFEVGFLFSPTRSGQDPRYPNSSAVDHIVKRAPVTRSAHLCGQYAAQVMVGKNPKFYQNPDVFHRIQINHTSPDLDKSFLYSTRLYDRPVILQCRKEFPQNIKKFWQVQYLFDRSGGKGREEKDFPRRMPDWNVGFAGGIGPHNVVDVIKKINSDGVGYSGSYWLDMETHIRTDNKFDTKKIEKVLELVYNNDELRDEEVMLSETQNLNDLLDEDDRDDGPYEDDPY